MGVRRMQANGSHQSARASTRGAGIDWASGRRQSRDGRHAAPSSRRDDDVDRADHASERERLLIRTAAAAEFNDPAALALSESLTVRYPADPSGHYFVGRTRTAAGDFLGAIAQLVRTVDMDSLAFRGVSMGCRAYDAMSTMIQAYWMADSLPAAERVARDWVRRQPRSPGAWAMLSSMLKQQQKNSEALAIDDTVARLGSARARPATTGTIAPCSPCTTATMQRQIVCWATSFAKAPPEQPENRSDC